MEKQLKENAVYAVFCGCLFIKNWRVPDHSNIERFRSRLSPKTQCQLANIIAKQACLKGFAKASDINIDSTVQKPAILIQPEGTGFNV
jgi:IS5 family transposase